MYIHLFDYVQIFVHQKCMIMMNVLRLVQKNQFHKNKLFMLYNHKLDNRIIPSFATRARGHGAIFFNALLTTDMDDDNSYRCYTLGSSNPTQYCQSQNFKGNFVWKCVKWIRK